VVAAASDPYSHLNSLASSQHQHYHQLHPAAQASRGHHVLSRRDEENIQQHLQGHMHSGLDGDVAVSNSSVSRRGPDMVYASVRRPDVLMHGGHHSLSEQDLLNLHNAQALSALEDAQVSYDLLLDMTCLLLLERKKEIVMTSNSHISLEYSRYSAETCWP